MPTEIPRELLRDRLRLFIQVLLIIDLMAYVSDAVTPLLIEGAISSSLTPPFNYLRSGVTFVLATSWAATRFARPPRVALIAIEVALMLTLALSYGFLGRAFEGRTAVSTGPVFTMVGVTLLLVVRSALVPSPVLRTLLIGVATYGVGGAVTRTAVAALDPVALDGLTFMSGAFVAATATTSHVIYGLRREVRDAMRLGQYQLERKLGAGGMGVVYRATHVMLRRPTAVKLLPTDAAAEQAVRRFEREVRETSRLEHPNSVRIYDYGRTPEGQFYYAMEYLDGVNLQQLVELEGPLPEARIVQILAQAAHALAEAHELGLVHRDVKPANIMLCDRGRIPDTVKVLDFGLVKQTGADEMDAGITHANAIIGTPQYMAPEAITDPETIGPPADVYALGAVGFHLLTARELFPAKTVVEVCSKHLTATPESLAVVRGAPVDPALEALILRCLEKAPSARPPDGAALAEALEQLALGDWTRREARDWWDAFGARPETTETESSGKTQLTIDVHRRA